jgi:hypothetical protein
MEYSKYKLVKQLFDKLQYRGLRPKVRVTLYNNRKIEGFLYDVKNNYIYVLKMDGRITFYSYTQVKELEFFGDPVIEKIYKEVMDNI